MCAMCMWPLSHRGWATQYAQWVIGSPVILLWFEPLMYTHVGCFVYNGNILNTAFLIHIYSTRFTGKVKKERKGKCNCTLWSNRNSDYVHSLLPPLYPGVTTLSTIPWSHNSLHYTLESQLPPLYPGATTPSTIQTVTKKTIQSKNRIFEKFVSINSILFLHISWDKGWSFQTNFIWCS